MSGVSINVDDGSLALDEGMYDFGENSCVVLAAKAAAASSAEMFRTEDNCPVALGICKRPLG